MGVLDWIERSARTGLLARVDRAMCRQEAREHDAAARRVEQRAERHNDPRAQAEMQQEARELRNEAQQLRERGTNAEDTNDDTNDDADGM